MDQGNAGGGVVGGNRVNKPPMRLRFLRRSAFLFLEDDDAQGESCRFESLEMQLARNLER